MSMWTPQLRKLPLKNKHRHSNRWRRGRLSSSRMMTMMMTTRRRFQAPTTLINMLTCRFQRNSRKCLNTYSDISHRRLNWTQRSSLSSQTTSLQSARLMPSSRCQSPTVRRKIWVLQFSTNPASTPKTRLS